MNNVSLFSLTSFLFACVLAMPSLSWADEDYLFDVLENPEYRQTWDALIASQQDVPSWLANYGDTQNGPATPAVKVRSGEKDYQINFVCKTHDCGNNKFYVLFSADGTQAWGLLLQEEDEIFFGAPDADKQQLLRTEANLISE